MKDMLYLQVNFKACLSKYCDNNVIEFIVCAVPVVANDPGVRDAVPVVSKVIWCPWQPITCGPCWNGAITRLCSPIYWWNISRHTVSLRIPMTSGRVVMNYDMRGSI